MAVRSKDFVGIAEGIRSHELSTKSQIENLKGHMSELSGRRSSLNSTISYLEAAIAAAYEDTDEDGDPDYGLIASLEAEKGSAENELSGVEQDLDSTGSELESKQNELEAVEEEKAQTLFEIQERARKTSQNISLAGGMYGSYVGVGSTLQNSLQTSLSSLTQAAGILGGSVAGATGGASGSITAGIGSVASGEVGTSAGSGNTETGALAAFTGGYSGEALPSSASQFSTSQDQLVTPATMPNYHSGQRTLNIKAPQNFSSEQSANEYALSSFGDVAAPQIESPNVDGYSSNQTSQSLESQFISIETPAAGTPSTDTSGRQHTFADWLDPANYTENGRYIGVEQTWGYKPYGGDSGEYGATIMTPAQQALNSYMQEHNYGLWDYSIYSKDPSWQKLYKAAYPTSAKHNIMTPQEKLQQYMYEHNYGWDDYITYSRDPEWQRLAHAIRSFAFAGHSKRATATLHYMKIPEDMSSVGEKTRTGSDTFFGSVFSKIKTTASSLKAVPLEKRYSLLRNTDTGDISKDSLYALTSLATDVLKKNFSSVFSDERFKNLSKDIILLSKEDIEKFYPNARSDIAGFYCSENKKTIIKKGAQIPIGRFLHTYVHELLHKLSHGDGYVGVLETHMYQGVKFEKNRGLNEGITDLYACRAMESVIPKYFAQSYPTEIFIVKRLESIYGKNELLEVFSHGKIEDLRKDFDSCFGENGKFDEFSSFVDEINLLILNGKKASSPKVSSRISKVLDILDEYERLKKDSNYRFRRSLKADSVNIPSGTASSSSKSEAPKKDSRERAIGEEPVREL